MLAPRVVENVPVLRGRVPEREMVMATIHGHEDKEAVVQAHGEGKGRKKRGRECRVREMDSAGAGISRPAEIF